MLWAVENEVTKGVDKTHFKPNDVCNRAQVVTFLWRAAGCPEPEPEPLSAVITANKGSVAVDAGDSATLTVVAAGGKAPYEYQWESYSESRQKWGKPVGQTNSTYVIKSGGRYRCSVTDAAGTTVYSNELSIENKYG